MADTQLIEARHLYYYYGEHCAVEDATFSVGKGEILGFLGLNGAGKSTTLRMISGNLTPGAGTVLIGGQDLAQQPLRAKMRLGYLPDRPPLYDDLTVNEYLDYVARLHRVRRQFVRPAIEQAKLRCGLGSMGSRLIGHLSKGYQQRVGIAQAIVHSPDIVLLDEPTVGLDPVQIREIRNLIRELGRDHGVILSSHILPEVEATCTRVIILHRGRIVFSTDLKELANGTQATSLIVSFRRPPEIAELASVTAAADVEQLSEGRFRLTHAVGRELGESLAELAVSRDWGLLELTPQHKTLEQTFVELTCSDEADPHNGRGTEAAA